MRGWYILPVMTPTHLLSVQVLEDERMVEGLDWYILPVLNPDGYQFTHEHVITTKLFVLKIKSRNSSGSEIKTNIFIEQMIKIFKITV